MNIKQFITVIVLLMVSAGIALYNRTTKAEDIPSVATSNVEKTPDFANMRVLKAYTVHETDITIRVIDNEAFTSFGPGSVTIYKNNKEICRKQIANDGGTIYDFNVDIKNDSENIYVTLKGCEQKDETVTLPIK